MARSDIPKPPSYEEWVADGLRRGGHTVDESLQFAGWHAAFEDQQAELRALPAAVISPQAEPRPVMWLRRLFGR